MLFYIAGQLTDYSIMCALAGAQVAMVYELKPISVHAGLCQQSEMKVFV
jgi:hypothetical protein